MPTSIPDRTQVYILVMAVILKEVELTIIQVSRIGRAAVEVYSQSFQCAHRDRSYAQNTPGVRADTVGTSRWSHKAITNSLSMGKVKVVRQPINCQIMHLSKQSAVKGPPQAASIRDYRATHQSQMKARRHALSFLMSLHQ